MATQQWKPIGAADQAFCDQFVEIMHAMDVRYRAFATEHLQEWLAGVTGPYVGDVVAAFAWFPQIADMSFPGRMQIVLLGRYTPNAATADLLMLGWVPPTADCQPAYLDSVIDEILAKGAEWLGTLNAAAPVKEIVTTRPATMGHLQTQLLHDRVYQRATAAPPAAGQFVQLVRERATRRASNWQLQISA